MALAALDVFNFVGTAASIASLVQQNSTAITSTGRVTVNALEKWLSRNGNQTQVPFGKAAQVLETATNAERRQIASLSLKLVIDQRLLDALIKKVTKCQEEHVERIDETRECMAMFFAHKSARECVCSVLMDIKSFNKGKLPTPFLRKVWDSYGCFG